MKMVLFTATTITSTGIYFKDPTFVDWDNEMIAAMQPEREHINEIIVSFVIGFKDSLEDISADSDLALNILL